MIYEPPTFCHIYFSLKAQSEAGSRGFFLHCVETSSLQKILFLPFFVAPHSDVWRYTTELKFWDEVKKGYKVRNLFTTEVFIVSICEKSVKRNLNAFRIWCCLQKENQCSTVHSAFEGTQQEACKHKSAANQATSLSAGELSDFTPFLHTCLKLQ